jgi:hypothetical protein
MSSVKIFTPDDWDGIQAVQHQVKVASHGLGPNDAKDAEKFMSPETAHFFRRMSLNPDCFYVHKIAMGSSDRYGPNRWGDGFSEKALRNDVHTFEKHGKAYRQHNSKGDYYGHVKIARFREDDGIVELITEYYGTPKVAAANGGKVADEEIELLIKQGYIPVSMGSLVPYDECSTCGHKAPTRKEHCLSKKEGGMCNMFGCRNGMLKVAADGRLQYVDNPYNTFYDISKVRVGADPIANGVLLPVGEYYEGLRRNAKVAEFALAQLPESIDDSPITRAIHLSLSKLASAEYLQSKEGEAAAYADAGFCKIASLSTDMTRQAMGSITQQQTAFGHAASRKEYLSFSTMCKLSGMTQGEIESAATFLPDLYQRIKTAGLSNYVVDQASKLASVCQGYKSKFFVSKTAGLLLPEITRASLMSAARGEMLTQIKPAPAGSALPDVAVKYAAFELCLTHLSDDADLRLHGLVRRKFYLL